MDSLKGEKMRKLKNSRKRTRKYRHCNKKTIRCDYCKKIATMTVSKDFELSYYCKRHYEGFIANFHRIYTYEEAYKERAFFNMMSNIIFFICIIVVLIIIIR